MLLLAPSELLAPKVAPKQAPQAKKKADEEYKGELVLLLALRRNLIFTVGRDYLRRLTALAGP